MGKGRQASFNVSQYFFAFVKISPCGKFKKFKTNKAILAIVIERKVIMMKTFLGNISVQKKKIIQKSIWNWYLAVLLN